MDYLHTEYASSNSPHGNLKSTNVLIGSDYEPLLVDYGLHFLITSNQVTQLFAYKSPEVVQGGQVSPKCDMYCLGVLIFEIIIRKFSTQHLNHANGGNDVIEWVKSTVNEGREAELLDPETVNDENTLGAMRRLLQIGAACADSNPEQRLDIREASRRIEEIQLDEDEIHQVTENSQDRYRGQITQQIDGNKFGMQMS